MFLPLRRMNKKSCSAWTFAVLFFLTNVVNQLMFFYSNLSSYYFYFSPSCVSLMFSDVTAALGLCLEKMSKEDLDATKDAIHSILQGVSCWKALMIWSAKWPVALL